VRLFTHVTNRVKALKGQSLEHVTQTQPEVRWDLFQHWNISEDGSENAIGFVIISSKLSFAPKTGNNLMRLL
jgi:hypothetical protein